MAKGAAGRYPAYTTGEGQRDGPRVRAVEGQLRDGRRRARRTRHQRRDAATGSRPALRPGRTARRTSTRRASPPTASATRWSRPSPSPPTPAPSTPTAPPNKPNVGIGFAAGTGGGYGPVGVNGSRVFLPFGLDPARTPVMGSYDENAGRRQGHLGVVPAAAPHAGPPAGDRRRRGRHLVLRRGRQLQLRPVAEAAVGRAPARRHVPGAGPGAADRHHAAERLAQPALPAGLGAARGQRGPDRRRRPEPVRPTSGSRSPRRGCPCWRPRSSCSVRRRRC